MTGTRREPFQYAMVRVVPRVERGEALNVGLVVFCRPLDFLDARIELDGTLLSALAPRCDAAIVAQHLDGYGRIARGEPGAGPIAQLSVSERFHWLVAPSSTIVQPSPAHTGLTSDPAGELERLFDLLVRR